MRVRRGRGMHKEGEEMEREWERRRESQKDRSKQSPEQKCLSLKGSVA